jgi:hypothetical protein
MERDDSSNNRLVSFPIEIAQGPSRRPWPMIQDAHPAASFQQTRKDIDNMKFRHQETKKKKGFAV